MNATGRKRLLKLAGFLEKLPRKKFNFASVVRGKEPPRKQLDCGSTACAIGWCPVVFPRLCEYAPSNQYSVNDYVVVPKGEEKVQNHLEHVARHIFGLDRMAVSGLFDPYGQDLIGEDSLGYDATPKQVARLIRRFVKKNP